MSSDPHEESQVDRSRLWRSMERLEENQVELGKEIANKLEAMSETFRQTWQRFVEGYNDTAGALKSRVQSCEMKLETHAEDIKALKAANERKQIGWEERIWKVVLTVGLGYIGVKLGLK